jgi:uncharacterized protein YpiB (UPF0302 family)
VVLSQIEFQEIKLNIFNSSEPSTFSVDDIRQMRRVLKQVAGPASSENIQKVKDFVEKVTTENTLLKAKAAGLRKAVQIKKKRRKRGKPLFHNLRNLNDGKAMFWSPSKIQAAYKYQEDQTLAKEQEKAQKAESKLQKQLQKEENERMIIQRRQIREQERMAKKAQKEEELSHKQAAQQLKKDLQRLRETSKGFKKASSSKQQAVVTIQSDEEGNGAEIEPARPRRQITVPRHLKGYDLSV